MISDNLLCYMKFHHRINKLIHNNKKRSVFVLRLGLCEYLAL